MFQIACDTGGTFTDMICVDTDKGVMEVVKTPSTPKDPSISFFNGLEKMAKQLGLEFKEFLNQTERIIYGTTVATNTILTRTGANTGLITTEGFRDVLIQNRANKPGNRFDPTNPPPPEQWMVAPRYLTVEADERVKYDGRVHKPLDEESVTKCIRTLKERGAESIAVCYLFSFLYPEHELKTREIIQREWPNIGVSLSYEILPEIREYNRMSTTVLNAYIQPRVADYLVRLMKKVRDLGYKEPLLVAVCSGGVARAEVVARHCITIINSGPAAAPTSGNFYGHLHGWKNLITIDMGGTSFDVAAITEGKIGITRESVISDLVYCIPSVDVYTIGAGGGSIAHLDAAGVLRVGPASAGADPGPACYKISGKEPTVTDADVVLGYLNPDYFLGGEIKIYPELAYNAIKEKIADPLGMSVAQAAASIYHVINTNMADAIRMITVRRGEDPRRFVVVTAGGAGPVHAIRLAQEMEISTIFIPRESSVFCPLGMISTDLRHDFTRTYLRRTEKADPEEMTKLYQEMETEASKLLEEEGIKTENRVFHRSVDMHYVGQVHELEAEVPNGVLKKEDFQSIANNFHNRHETLYSYKEPESPTEIQSLRLTAFGKLARPSIKKIEKAKTASSVAIKSKRKVFWSEYGDYVDTTIYDYLKLLYGHRIEGPCIIEQKNTTIVVPPKTKVELDEYGNYIIKL